MREEAEELARMGCPYIQVDAPDFGQLIDPSQQTVWAAAGIPFHRVMTEGADMLNEVANVPGVTFGVHICKCGFASAGPGNAISKDAKEKKLRLIAEVANRVWRRPRPGSPRHLRNSTFEALRPRPAELRATIVHSSARAVSPARDVELRRSLADVRAPAAARTPSQRAGTDIRRGGRRPCHKVHAPTCTL